VDDNKSDIGLIEEVLEEVKTRDILHIAEDGEKDIFIAYVLHPMPISLNS
jgi:hypothetical protein